MLKKLFIGLSVCVIAFLSAINSNVIGASEIVEVEAISKAPKYVDEDRNRTTTSSTTTTTTKRTTTTTSLQDPDI